MTLDYGCRQWVLIPKDEQDKILADAKRLRGTKNWTWSAIARKHRLAIQTIRRRLDAEYADRLREIARIKNGADFRGDGPRIYVDPEARPDPAVVAASRRAIPIDTRSVTQRILGDPLPGRSALDRRIARLNPLYLPKDETRIPLRETMLDSQLSGR